MAEDEVRKQFLSTPSVGRATASGSIISITSVNFYPRPPWGGRQMVGRGTRICEGFLSTPSVGRATVRPGENPV